MQFTFNEIIAQLNSGYNLAVDNFAFNIVRATVIPSDYLLASFLPEELHPSYQVQGGSVTIYPTMIGQAAMDSPYPPLGTMTSEFFQENTTKLGGSMFFTEKDLRDLQQWEQQIITTGFARGLSTAQIAGDLRLVNGRGDNNTINGRRLNALLGMTLAMSKAHWDRREWLRSEALFKRGIDWTFNGKQLKVVYDAVPAGNFQTNRTSTNAYNGSASKFWDDIRWLYTKLNNFILVMNQNTYNAIIDQSANKISVVADDNLIKQIVKVDTTSIRQTNDFRNRQTIYVYNKSGTYFDPITKEITPVSFVPDGKILAIGEARAEGFELLQGSVDDVTLKYKLGYTHIAPTVESGGMMGTWADIHTPANKPMQVLGETAGNTLPMIIGGKRLAVLSSDIS